MSKQDAIYIERDKCPVYVAIRVIEGRWKPMIFRRLGEGARGFGEFRRMMPGVTVKVLREQLRQLETEGVVKRSVHREPTLRVRYQLTSHGRALGPVFESLWMWGVRHFDLSLIWNDQSTRTASFLFSQVRGSGKSRGRGSGNDD